MSANNWSYCPQCYKEFAKELDKSKKKLKSDYGYISADEYVKRYNDLKNKEPDDLETTLREDYCIFTDSKGDFHIEYKCSCTKCGFTKNFEIDKNWLNE